LNTDSLLVAVDAEIARLREVRALLSHSGASGLAKKSGRKSAKKAVAKKIIKRTMSPEGRARIAEAQRKRWAAQKSKGK
jgi:hypothetical protein